LKPRTYKISKQANAFSTVLLLYRRQEAAQRKQAESLKSLSVAAHKVALVSSSAGFFCPLQSSRWIVS
jgi:SUMO ligase MMS21 Smc5/6 complex component